MKCPRCNEEIVVGRVCPVCGYELEDDGTGVASARGLSSDMENLLNDMKDEPEMSLGRAFSAYLTWILPMVAVCLFVMALKSEAGMFWILFALTAAAAVWKMFAHIRISRSVATRNFDELHNEMDSMIRTAKREYGSSVEMMKIVKDFEEQMFRIAKSREAATRRNRAIALVICIVLLVIAILSVVAVFSLIS